MKREAYKEHSLENLPDEVWKEIDGYEGYYEVSNHGRVKSLPRYVEHSRFGWRFIHPRILRQNIKKSTSKHFEDYYVDCQVALNKHNKVKYHSVKRLVYSSFVEKQDFKKNRMCIVNKDFNGYNNHIDNLDKVSYSERFKRIKGRNRFYDFLKTADRSSWPKTYGAYSRMIPIKHTSSDNEVTEYKSIAEASRALKLDASDIGRVLKGKKRPFPGHHFEYL